MFVFYDVNRFRYTSLLEKTFPNWSKKLFSTMSDLLNAINEVDIDEYGKFKYVLIDVQDASSKKLIVRGYARAQWHADIFEETERKVKELGKDLKTNCLGGGRILHDPDEKTLKVFGYSQGYGKADHEVTVSILKKKYPDYNITWSDEGY
ncbi:sex-regulated protein janus-A-like [Prorops nasuta]|uniref:sex-regulated protein janus-A-like n=1 Tax=Prorops nasuta TaxID=863751 RepID=UPI0034CE3FBF